jgi:hypothetical protein
VEHLAKALTEPKQLHRTAFCPMITKPASDSQFNIILLTDIPSVPVG